ncbi:2,3-diketo-5-methylthio-1-phosphopentane phosphatase [Allomyces macrogynus ATCC 38327]|uniref:2,3-diketo-5-methylthio-1-phosphopentane phosphatase n=1 Tax=Allomyces macrogynus (strain ATCC 38327) TaxID=578462 RepID=A0A0L0SB03_ALLM3|nr:2,3-diketo-5-methylthio-1-phosphopentane phosphatase [Allomyces macrogynus ATCC 38327]|eukprot:KNE59612.1 2,3-diketo-5-methylthio-1-phosphopentane phosphatase [Allomyces macrogynus ATCC 38327]
MDPMDVDAPAAAAARALRPYRVVLADIEGTTTDIAFVHNELFPYARAHLPAYVRQHASDPAVQAILRDLHTQSLADAQAAKQPKPSPIYADFAPVTSPTDLDSAIAHLQWLMRHDVKRGPLKSLQGLVWAAAYATRAVQGHIYPDVVPALLAWRHLDVPVSIYSSGSVPAQKLLFGHSTYGDLQPYFADYFDTAVGAKVAPQSYATIFNRLNADFAQRNLVPLAPSDILFLSDNGAELVAARRIGIQAVLVVREGNSVVTEDAKREFFDRGGVWRTVCAARVQCAG